MTISPGALRLALSKAIEAELLNLSRPAAGASWEEACRTGTAQVDAPTLAAAAERQLGGPAGGQVDLQHVRLLFTEAWNEAVRRAGLVEAGVDWQDNGKWGADCAWLFGYLEAAQQSQS